MNGPANGPGPVPEPAKREVAGVAEFPSWLWLKQVAWRRDDYGIALVLIVATIMSLAFAGDVSWGRELAIALGGGTLMFVLHTSGARHRAVLLTGVVVTISILGSGALILAATPALAEDTSDLVGYLLAVIAPVVILRHIVRSRLVTYRLVIGALCIYLLIGLAYVYAFPMLARLSGTPFFVQLDQPSSADYIYFSYTTLTTVGYGDLTAAESAGRLLAISEALLGQLYLVSAVAMLVGSIGHSLRRDRDG